MAFGPAPQVFRAATDWAEQSGRTVSTWCGGGLVAAIAAVGCTLGSGKEAKDAVLHFVMPLHSAAGRPPWADIPAVQQFSILAAASPAEEKREILEYLLSQSPRRPEFCTSGRLAALIEIVGDQRLPLLFGWIESFDPGLVAWEPRWPNWFRVSRREVAQPRRGPDTGPRRSRSVD
jgi:hypothetical protein